MTMKITDESLRVFLAYAKDACNWGGEPLVGGNVRGDKKAERGNLTQLKRAGLIETGIDRGDVFIFFTAAGKALAAEHRITL